jgi:hypothetical protein
MRGLAQRFDVEMGMDGEYAKKSPTGRNRSGHAFDPTNGRS